MSYLNRLCIVVIVVADIAVAPRCQSQASAQSSPVVYDWTAAGSSKTLMPEVNGDVFIVRHVSDPVNIGYSVYTRAGKLVSRFKIEIPEARQTIGGRIAALPGGSGYVAIAIAVNSTERVATLCFLNRGGELKKVVRTSPFWPYFIAVTEEGTIWAFGAAGPDDVRTSDEPLLYRFSKTGDLLGKMLPRRLFGEEPPFDPPDQLGSPQLTTAGNRVVLYAAYTRQLFEFSLEGKLVGSYLIPLPNREVAGAVQAYSMPVRGMRVTSKGSVYARLAGGDAAGIYELDRAVQRWVPLPPDLMEKSRDYALIGSAGDDLALIPGGVRDSSVTLDWLHVEPRFAVAQ